MPRIFDHIDLRVPSLQKVTPFYSALLPALGFSRAADIPGWLQFYAATDMGEAPGANIPTAFFGIAQDPLHKPNASRIAFWAETPDRKSTRLNSSHVALSRMP